MKPSGGDDRSYRRSGHRHADSFELADDPQTPPARILPREAQHEIAQVRIDSGPAATTVPRRPTANEVTVPTTTRVRRHHQPDPPSPSDQPDECDPTHGAPGAGSSDITVPTRDEARAAQPPAPPPPHLDARSGTGRRRTPGRRRKGAPSEPRKLRPTPRRSARPRYWHPTGTRAHDACVQPSHGPDFGAGDFRVAYGESPVEGEAPLTPLRRQGPRELIGTTWTPSGRT